MTCPGVEVVLRRNSAANTVRSPDRPVLSKSLRTVDGRCIDTSGGVDIVGAAVGLNGALELPTARGVVRAKGLHNVVLHERIASPSIDGEVAVAIGAVCS